MAIQAAGRQQVAAPIGALGRPTRGAARVAGQGNGAGAQRTTLDGVAIDAGRRWWGRLAPRTRRALLGVPLALLAALGLWGVTQVGLPALAPAAGMAHHSAATHSTSHATTHVPPTAATSTPTTQPAHTSPLALVGQTLIWLFGWGAYPTLALLLTLGGVWLAEGVARRRLLRRWLTVSPLALWLLAELEARLAGNPATGGVVGDALAAPLAHAPLALTQLLVLLLGLALTLVIGVTLANDAANALVALPGATLRTLRPARHPAPPRAKPASNRRSLAADQPEQMDGDDTRHADDDGGATIRRGAGRAVVGEVGREATGELGRGAMDALLAAGAVEAAQAIHSAYDHHHAGRATPASPTRQPAQAQSGGASATAVATAPTQRNPHPLISAFVGRTRLSRGTTDAAASASAREPARLPTRGAALGVEAAGVASHKSAATPGGSRISADSVVALAEELARQTQRALLDLRAVTQVYPLEISATAIRLCVRPLERLKRDEQGRIVTDGQGEPVVVRTRVSRIVGLRDELAQALGAPGLSIAPLPPEESRSPEQPGAIVVIPRE